MKPSPWKLSENDPKGDSFKLDVHDLGLKILDFTKIYNPPVVLYTLVTMLRYLVFKFDISDKEKQKLLRTIAKSIMEPIKDE
jgi:hypothetical protein